jgi:nicotinate-nucleotide adenylyltransferase
MKPEGARVNEGQSGRLGVFGGTFDPIHLGHLIVAEELAYQLKLDQVLFLLASRPPHKTDWEISSDADRLVMLELGLAGNSRFAVSRADIERPGLSFTADSLTVLQQQFPDQCLYFLMGQDSLRDFPTWHDPNRIARQALLGVAMRPGVEINVEAIVRQVPEARDRIILVNVPLIDISARDIRQRIREGRPIRYQVPREVERYIVERRLHRHAHQGSSVF